MSICAGAPASGFHLQVGCGTHYQELRTTERSNAWLCREIKEQEGRRGWDIESIVTEGRPCFLEEGAATELSSLSVRNFARI
jgi:hypothetical protein